MSGSTTMDAKKRKKLEAAGWRVGEAEDFLELSPDEVAYIETKLALSRGLRAERERLGLTQEQVARKVGSSQSRVAKMEAGDSSVSLDLLIRTLLKLGTGRRDLAALVRPERRTAGSAG
jgi:DNA-binding XRE family transcriptional regulator